MQSHLRERADGGNSRDILPAKVTILQMASSNDRPTMSFDAAKVDRIIQYSLLCAGEEDDVFDRQLGPIHLIKYVYLADLAYAERNDGALYTGLRWTFYRFGPWSQEANARLEPALSAIHADRRTFESDLGDRDDWVRWWKRDGSLLAKVQAELPAAIASRLKLEIHRFRKDTPSLLDHVYKTAPMLGAAPNEVLDFSAALKRERSADQSPLATLENLSEKKKKKLREGLRILRENRKARSPRSEGWVVPPEPRYDEIYEQGMAWLEELAGPPLPEGEQVVEFSEDVWKSSARKGHDVS